MCIDCRRRAVVALTAALGSSFGPQEHELFRALDTPGKPPTEPPGEHADDRRLRLGLAYLSAAMLPIAEVESPTNPEKVQIQREVKGEVVNLFKQDFRPAEAAQMVAYAQLMADQLAAVARFIEEHLLDSANVSHLLVIGLGVHRPDGPVS